MFKLTITLAHMDSGEAVAFADGAEAKVQTEDEVISVIAEVLVRAGVLKDDEVLVIEGAEGDEDESLPFPPINFR